MSAASLTGMSRISGVALSGDDHLAQSIADIITTPLGSRVMRRDYGCLLFDLIDRPLGPATALLCSMAIAIALARWEPRIELKVVRIEGELAAGQASVTIEGIRSGSTANSLTRLSIPIARRT
jgi:hypothetical protein